MDRATTSQAAAPRVFPRVRAAIAQIAASHRVLSRAGVYRAATAPGVRAVLQAALGGKTGPWLVYRYHANNSPERLAVIAGERRFTFAAWDAGIDRVAAGLAARGLGAGSAAVVMLKNRPEFLLAQSGIARLGGTAVSAYWRSSPEELAFIAGHSDARAVFFEAEAVDAVREAARHLPGIPAGNYIAVGGAPAGFAAFEEAFPPCDRLPDRSATAAVLMYTSGTTGIPKGAVRKFPNGALHGVLGFMGETPMRADDVHLQTMPLYHGTGFGFISMSHMLGATVVLLEEFSPRRFLELIERHRVTQVSTGPALLHRVVTELSREEIRRYDTSSLRAIFCGGARMPGPVATRALDAFGDVLYNVYGATETSHNAIATPADLRAAPGTIGRAVPGNEIALLRDDGCEVPPGQVGELCVRNATQIAGYYKNEQAMRDAVRDGFFATGDLARADERGYYHLAGRKGEVIHAAAGSLYPVPIECVIEAHPDVSEVAVVGVPEPDAAVERVCAFVVRRAGSRLDEAVLRDHCRERLSEPERPASWVFLDVLPRNATGKVMKRELREGRR